MITARVLAGLIFLAALIFLALAHRRLRDRARAEEADGLIREAFENLERDPPENPGPRTT